MKMIVFEAKKLWRMAGLRKLCTVILVLNLLAVMFGGLSEPDAAASEAHRENYENNISYVIRVAERNRAEYEITAGRDSYLVRYQEQVIGHYSVLLEEEVRPLPVRGWNAFFDHRADDVLLMVLVILLGVSLTVTERDCGTHTLLRLTSRGRAAYRSKLVLLSLLALVLPWLMNAVTALGIALRFGLSSPAVPLCSVIDFAYCPLGISILSYLALSSLMRSLSLLALALFSAWAASVVGSYLAAFFVSAGALLSGFGLSQTDGVPAFLNPYVLTLVDPLWKRYRAWNLFGLSIPLIGTAVILSAWLCLVLAALFMRATRQSVTAQPFERLGKALSQKLSRLGETCRALLPARRPRRRSLLASEAKKSFIKSRLLLLCAVMLIAKLAYADATAPKVYTNEVYYRQVCEALTGSLTEEKRQQIEDTLAESAAILAQETTMRNNRISGLITEEEYSVYQGECDRAYLDKYAYERLAAQCRRIDAAAARGQEAYIVYDSGWNTALSRGADVLLYAFLALFFSGIYAMEYQYGMDRTAKTTARGAASLHKSKLALAAIVGLVAFVVFWSVDTVILLRALPLPHAAFPLASVRETALSLPLWLTLSLSSLWHLIKALVLSVGVCGLSRLLKRVYLTLPAALLLALALLP